MNPPTFPDILAAQKRIRPYLPRTPLHSYSAINELIGTEVFIKHENYQPVGAFKVRGGINLISQLTAEESRNGVIAASTGNHGQSVAYAARLFGIPARIVVPEGANPGKVAAMRGMGAEVIFYGAKFDDSVQRCAEMSASDGSRYVHSGDEPLIIAGVGTVSLEMLEDQPDLDVLIVPAGGGSGAAGACITAAAINPKIRVIGTQSAASPAVYESWRKRQIVSAPNQTFADGLATGRGFNLPLAVLFEMLSDFVLVEDDAIRRAMVWMIERAHTLAEPAGAVALAAAYQIREELAGKKVGIVCSGGNASLDHLRGALRA